MDGGQQRAQREPRRIRGDRARAEAQAGAARQQQRQVGRAREHRAPLAVRQRPPARPLAER